MRFNARLLIDIFYEADCAGKMHLLMGILDEGTHLHVCPLVKARDQATLWDALLESWFTPFGPPEALLLDKEGGLDSNFFADKCSDLGVQVRMIPADAHFQAGKIESQNYALKRILRKTIDQSQCVGPEMMKVAAIFACQAKNSLVRRSGVSAHMHAFGREVRLPGALLSDPDNPELHSRIDKDTDLQNIMEIRANANRSCVDFEHDSRLSESHVSTRSSWKSIWEVARRKHCKDNRAEEQATGRKASPRYAIRLRSNYPAEVLARG